MQITFEKSLIMIGVAMLSGAVLGLSPSIAALVIMGCAVGFSTRLIQNLKIQKASFWCLMFLLYTVVSGQLLGGFTSANETSLMSWIGREGRVFLYYWPALFILEAVVPSDTGLVRILRILTVFVLINVLMKVAVGFSTFGTHHAAGAFSAMLVIFHVFRYGKTRDLVDLTFLLLSVLALLGSNSRTALLAVMIALALVIFSLRQIKKVMPVLIAAPIALVLMSSLFPYQFDRLRNAANIETVTSVRENFRLAYASNSPFEVGKAWDLGRNIDLSGNVNLAIRGYLFGRTFGEFARSPVIGIGFGRINDIGRTFAGVPGVYYTVSDTTFASPTNQTAHNSYLQILAELGILGALPLALMYGILWRRLHTAQYVAPEWSKIGRASLICICFMGLTQHAFGAPIYGLSLFLLAVISYRKAQAAMALEKDSFT